MVRTELVLLGTGHIKAATIPWLAPCLLFHRRVCGFKDGWGTRTSPQYVFDPDAFNLLALQFLCFEKGKVVSSEGSFELKIRSWMVNDLDG